MEFLGILGIPNSWNSWEFLEFQILEFLEFQIPGEFQPRQASTQFNCTEFSDNLESFEILKNFQHCLTQLRIYNNFLEIFELFQVSLTQLAHRRHASTSSLPEAINRSGAMLPKARLQPTHARKARSVCLVRSRLRAFSPDNLINCHRPRPHQTNLRLPLLTVLLLCERRVLQQRRLSHL